MRPAGVYFHLYKFGLRYLVGAITLIIFIRWMRKMPEMPAAMPMSEINAMEFFHEKLKDDGIHFTWAHAVNEYSKLKTCLKDKVNGIEADVVLKNEGTDAQEMMPIMAHPPVYTSDLTLRSFLHETLLGDSLVKLDFKSIAPVELALQMLSEMKDQITIPVWLNADILQGPGSAPVPSVPAVSFLRKVMSGYSHCTLSLGWTTSTDKMLSYSWANVYEMSEVIHNNIPKREGKHLTFAVNASLLKNSIIPLKWLCEQYDASLTVWQSQAGATVDILDLIYLRSKIPRNRVLYDLLPETMKEFSEKADSTDLIARAHVQRDIFGYIPNNWVIKVSDQRSSDMKIGEEVVWLSGPDAQIMSSHIVKKDDTVLLKGTVSFLSMNATSRENNVKSNLQIFVLGHDHAASHPSGIRCSIDSRGRMIVASDHVSKAELYVDDHVGISPGSCYQYNIKMSGYYVEFTAAPLQFDCNYQADDPPKGKTLKVQVDAHAEHLVLPYSLILRNSLSEGYAIIEQLHFRVLDSAVTGS